MTRVVQNHIGSIKNLNNKWVLNYFRIKGLCANVFVYTNNWSLQIKILNTSCTIVYCEKYKILKNKSDNIHERPVH